MPAFKEYVAKGKLTPTDMGFTAMETAARRQQSFTADQVASVEKSAKAVGQAWEGSLKFGLDEIEIAQQQAARGGGGVKVAGAGKAGRTLLGTGAGGDTNWNARANASNAAADGASKLSQLARGLNNKVAPPVTAADGIVTDPDSGVSIARGKDATQRVVQLQNNPQQIPLGPGDINFRRLNEYGTNPEKQIIITPLGAPGTSEADYKMGTVAGQMSDQDIGPFAKSGARTWYDIKGALGFRPDPNAGYIKNPVGEKGDIMKPYGFDKNGMPFYATVESPKPTSTDTMTPTPSSPADTVDQSSSDITPAPDTSIPIPDAVSY